MNTFTVNAESKVPDAGKEEADKTHQRAIKFRILFIVVFAILGTLCIPISFYLWNGDRDESSKDASSVAMSYKTNTFVEHGPSVILKDDLISNMKLAIKSYILPIFFVLAIATIITLLILLLPQSDSPASPLTNENDEKGNENDVDQPDSYSAKNLLPWIIGGTLLIAVVCLVIFLCFFKKDKTKPIFEEYRQTLINTGDVDEGKDRDKTKPIFEEYWQTLINTGDVDEGKDLQELYDNSLVLYNIISEIAVKKESNLPPETFSKVRLKSPEELLLVLHERVLDLGPRLSDLYVHYLKEQKKIQGAGEALPKRVLVPTRNLSFYLSFLDFNKWQYYSPWYKNKIYEILKKCVDELQPHAVPDPNI